MRTFLQLFLATSLIVSGVVLGAAPVQAQPVERTFCVFDIVGANGEVYNMMKDFKAVALDWGVRAKLKPYTDEKVAMEAFQAGQCDAVVLTGIRNRQLVQFAGSIDMMGAIPTYDHLEKAIESLARPKARQYMQTERYEVGGIFPAGAVYLFVRPEVMRKIDGTPTVDDLAGKEIAAMSYDQQALTMIRHVGGSVVGADITNFAGMFNNGSVDLAYAPAAAYKALELYKGLGEDGRVVDYPLAQLTYQMTLRRDRFPNDFAPKARDWAVKKFDELRNVAESYEASIPEEKWIEIPEEDVTKYQGMFRKVRQKLSGDVYDPRMMTLLKRIRCSMDPGLAECVDGGSN